MQGDVVAITWLVGQMTELLQLEDLGIAMKMKQYLPLHTMMIAVIL